MLLELLIEKRDVIIHYGSQLGFQDIGIVISPDSPSDPYEFIVTTVNHVDYPRENLALLRGYLCEIFENLGLFVLTRKHFNFLISNYPEGIDLIEYSKTVLANNVPLGVLDVAVPFESYLLPDLQEYIIQGDSTQIQREIECGALTRTPIPVSHFRYVFASIYPEKINQFDEAVVQASFTLRHNKKVLGHQIFYCYRVSDFDDLPIEVSELIAEYVGTYGQRFDTEEASILRALVERKEARGAAPTRTKTLKQSDSSDESTTEKSSEEAGESDKEESSSKSGSEKADGPSDASNNVHNENNNAKKESKNMDLLSQLQQQDDTPFELKLPETDMDKMKKEIEEDALIKRSQKDRREIEQELEDRKEVKAPNIFDKEEEENTNEDSETSLSLFDKGYPAIPEKGVIDSPTPIISDPSFTGSGAITFAISFGIFCIQHGGKHLHGEVPAPDLPDLYAI